MRIITAIVVSLIFVAICAAPAEARRYAHGYYSSAAYWQHRQVVARFYRPRAKRYARAHNARTGHGYRIAYDRGQIIAHPPGCPHSLFCGCGASIEAFGRSIRDLWLVSNWYRFPRATPADGMAVIWGTRHVAIIRRYLGNGVALLYDANSGGGLTRLHRRSIAGLAVVNPHPGKRTKLISWESTTPL